MIVKPAGARCNLACTYCFYREKESLHPAGDFRMADDVLEAFVRQYLGAWRAPEVHIAWQGGEPTLMGTEFFRRAVACTERHRRPGQTVRHSIQTNGTLLDDGWGAFLREHGFLVGVSVDGPKEMHDAYRRDPRGGGSFDRVMRGWECLRRHGAEANVLTAVHAANADRPREVYRFLRDGLGAAFLQFIPIVRRDGAGRVVAPSVGPAQYGRFLVGVFEEWARRDVGRVSVQTFDVALARRLGQHPLCVFAPTCGGAPVLEHGGDLYSCDHYVDEAHRLGNLRETPLADLMASDRQRRFGRAKRDTLPRRCRDCDVLPDCHGGCPRNRIARAPDGEPGLNYLCDGYRRFFRHARGPLDALADRRRGERPLRRAGRNEPCPCGSGRKYKRCHGR